jgi:hypothetical protein
MNIDITRHPMNGQFLAIAFDNFKPKSRTYISIIFYSLEVIFHPAKYANAKRLCRQDHRDHYVINTPLVSIVKFYNPDFPS